MPQFRASTSGLAGTGWGGSPATVPPSSPVPSASLVRKGTPGGRAVSVAVLLVSCFNGTVGRESGVISSPRYPNPYPPNARCRWELRTGDDEKVFQISIRDLSLEGEMGACVDFLQGPHSSKPRMKFYFNKTMK